MMLLLPILYFLYIQINCQIYAQNKDCSNCKYFIPHKNNKVPSLGLCKLFGNKVNSNENNKMNEKIVYNFAQHCRDDENLCGKTGLLYHEIEENKNYTENKNFENTDSLLISDDEIKKLINDYNKFLRNDAE